MEKVFVTCLVLFPGTLCVVASVILAFKGVTGWGWFLILGTIMVMAVSYGGDGP
ncbi:UNVERIFIED_ORG: hypothetical protein LHK14_00355 [Roseateles sp. XES5]|nr:hypothetical protein [Roseateles sp. XES5]